MSRETILVCCPECSGDGGWEGPVCHVDYRIGSAWGDWFTCTHCDGAGSTWEPLYEAPDPDDLDEYFNEAFASIVADITSPTP